MLPKKYRASRSQIIEAKKSNFVLNSPHFRLHIAKIGIDHSLYAVSVPKKVSKSAVDRNYYRRKVYENMKLIESVNRANLYLFVLKKPFKKSQIETIRKEMVGLSEKILEK